MQVIATCNDPGPLFGDELIEFVPVAATSKLTDDQVEIEGTITNTWKRTIDGNSWLGSVVRFDTRDASGAITGGGRGDLSDTYPPPGVSVEWSTEVRGLTAVTQAASIAAMFTPRFE